MAQVSFGRFAPHTGTVVVVGGGESLRGVDLSPLKAAIDRGHRVIAVNLILAETPATDFYSCHVELDPIKTMLEQHPRPLTVYAQVDDEFGSDRANTPAKRYDAPDWFTYIRQRPHPDLSPSAVHDYEDPTFCYTGNSGLGAYQAALRMGASRIILLGLDAKGGYANPAWGDPRDTYNGVAEYAGRSLPFVREKGIDVVYGSPEGRWPFPRLTPQEVIERFVK